MRSCIPWKCHQCSIASCLYVYIKNTITLSYLVLHICHIISLLPPVHWVRVVSFAAYMSTFGGRAVLMQTNRYSFKANWYIHASISGIMFAAIRPLITCMCKHIIHSCTPYKKSIPAAQSGGRNFWIHQRSCPKTYSAPLGSEKWKIFIGQWTNWMN